MPHIRINGWPGRRGGRAGAFRGIRAAAVLLAGALALTGCAGDDTGSGGAPAAGDDVRGTVTVFAAASLTEALGTLAEQFEDGHPGARVVVNFAGSSTLAAQIIEGAPADVFVSADLATMQRVVDAGLVEGEPTVLVRNQLVIAVPVGNPHGIRDLADLADPALKVALCAEQVPCGAAARTVLDAAGVRLTPVTLERDVKAALSKVTLGEVDAALVYRTDAAASPEVEGIEFAASARAVNDYPVAVLRDAPNPTAARAFLEFLFSEAGTAVLVEAGFQLP